MRRQRWMLWLIFWIHMMPPVIFVILSFWLWSGFDVI